MDPPRREGRAAFYDDHHLMQLNTINELLRKGYTSAHIAEFFDTMRSGHDLADILGLHHALFGAPRAADESHGAPEVRAGESAHRLEELGLVRRSGAVRRWVDDATADIVAGADDPGAYQATVLRIADGVDGMLDDVAIAIVAALEEGLADRFGPKYVPRPEDMADLRRLVTDYRRLVNRVIVTLLDGALRRRLVDAMAAYTTDIIATRDTDIVATRDTDA